MPTDIIKWIEINWKVLDTINENRSTIGSTEGMSKMNPVFPLFPTLTQSPTQMHKESELVDSFFFAPQERDMI